VLVSGCSTNTFTHNSVSTYASVKKDYNPANGSISIATNLLSWNVNRMGKYDRKQQENAVFFALNNLKPGEVTRWYNGNTGARGAVKMAMSYPQGSGYCRVIMSEIYYNNRKRDFAETACINAVDNSWRFIR
jgi:surface antigen